MTSDFETARALFGEGVALLQQDRFAEAAAALEASLAHLPGRASTLVNLGVARLGLRQPQQALEALDAAVQADASLIEGWCHRADALSALGRDDEAVASLSEALHRQPGHVAALMRRVLALNRLGRYGLALQDLETVLEREPGLARAWMLKGQTLQSLEAHAQALPAYDRAIELEPALGAAWGHRAHLLAQLNRPEEAAASFERAIACGDAPELHGYALAALRQQAAPSSAPQAYVRALFDPYARDFDRHLLEGLQYRAHEQVVQALPPGPLASVLDLGCGTGLCGALLADRTARLEGVDLSPAMLAQARARGVYDVLHEADIVHHLKHTSARHAAVVAADVFIYIGDLLEVFAGVARVLVPGGWFAFSVEHADDTLEHRLLPTMRYAQSSRYLRTLAASTGFEVVECHDVVLRREQGQDIAGRVMVLRLAGA